ncbi:L-gulonolactone oxidase-like [Glandiceps talaboti]
MAMNGGGLIAGLKGKLFTNWAKTFSCVPELYFQPTSVDEIKQVLQQARTNNKKVKVCGYGHSPSDIACTTDYMICLDKFNQVIEVNEEKCQVTAEAGLLVRDLNLTILPKHGMALSSLGSVSELSLAGSISTGTHGTGAKFGCLATNVVHLDLLTASGELISCSRDENKDIFLACCCGIGALGIIVHMTLQCEPEFRLWQRQSASTLDEVLANLDTHLYASEHFRFCWYPHTNNVAMWHVDRTTKPIQTKSSWFWDYAVGYCALEFAYWLSTFVPGLIPLINRLFYNLLFTKPVEQVNTSYKVFNFDCLFSQYVTEWAIPREQTGPVLKELKAWLESSGEVAHFPVEVRFVKADDILISPSHGRETCYLNIIMYRPYGKDVEYAKYWEAYEDIMYRAGGRPHWAKAHKITKDQFMKMYPQFGKFCEIRDNLDPDELFMNDYLERVLK